MRLDIRKKSAKVVVWTTLYSLCSSAMLLGNKVALMQLPYPITLTCTQLIFCAFFSLPIAWYQGFTQISKRDAVLFAAEGILFSMSICANLEALSHTNVGTLIVARSILPVLVYIFERTMGSKLQLTSRSMFSLLGVFMFGSLYAKYSKGITLSPDGCAWVVVWMTLVAVQMIYGKWLLSAVKLTHIERVMYTNFGGLPLMFPLANGEYSMFVRALLPSSTLVVALTCVVGIFIGYTSWQLRDVVSATTFSLVGVLNKMGTICIAFLFLPNEGTIFSFFCLLGCLASGFFYNGTEQVDEAINLNK